MICIAAFIVLGICVLTVPIIRLFNKKLANNIMRLFKRSMHCLSRHVTFRACDTSFQDDVKNTLLRKTVLKHPKWTRPLEILIEIASLAIIVLTIWSLLVGAKALVSLYVYGTCNPTTPSACSLDSTEACSIDEAPIVFTEDPVGWTGNWFKQFGEAIAAIPTRAKHWEASDYVPNITSYSAGKKDSRPVAVDIFDPGCVVCQRSYKAQKKAGFDKKYNVALMVYPIKSATESSGYKYPNSYMVASYIVATEIKTLKDAKTPAAWQIVDRMFTGKTSNEKEAIKEFDMGLSHDEAKKELRKWLKEIGYSDKEVKELDKLAKSKQVKDAIQANYDTVENEIKTKKIPTMIFNGTRHDGEFTIETKF